MCVSGPVCSCLCVCARLFCFVVGKIDRKNLQLPYGFWLFLFFLVVVLLWFSRFIHNTIIMNIHTPTHTKTVITFDCFVGFFCWEGGRQMSCRAFCHPVIWRKNKFAILWVVCEMRSWEERKGKRSFIAFAKFLACFFWVGIELAWKHTHCFNFDQAIDRPGQWNPMNQTFNFNL